MKVNKDMVLDVGTHLEVVVDGVTVLFDHQDSWIVEVFPNWFITKGHVSCDRQVQTPYGSLTQRLYMHKLVTGVNNKKWQIDHENRVKSDNRRSNLRMATASQNSANAVRVKGSNSGFRGVHRCARSLNKPYVVTFKEESGRRSSRRYATAEEAAREYDRKALERYGDFAVLNFPRADYE